jgi:hypothetical protein
MNPAKPAPSMNVGGGIKAPGAGGITDLAQKKPITSPMFGKSEDYDKMSPLYAELFKTQMELEGECGKRKVPEIHPEDKLRFEGDPKHQAIKKNIDELEKQIKELESK